MFKNTEKDVEQKGSQRGTVPTIGEDRGGKLIFFDEKCLLELIKKNVKKDCKGRSP